MKLGYENNLGDKDKKAVQLAKKLSYKLNLLIGLALQNGFAKCRQEVFVRQCAQ